MRPNNPPTITTSHHGFRYLGCYSVIEGKRKFQRKHCSTNLNIDNVPKDNSPHDFYIPSRLPRPLGCKSAIGGRGQRVTSSLKCGLHPPQLTPAPLYSNEKLVSVDRQGEGGQSSYTHSHRRDLMRQGDRGRGRGSCSCVSGDRGSGSGEGGRGRCCCNRCCS